MKDIISLINSTIIGLALIGAAFVATTTYSELKNKEIANEARYQCAQSSRYQTTGENDALVWYPVADLYQSCLAEKGIK